MLSLVHTGDDNIKKRSIFSLCRYVRQFTLEHNDISVQILMSPVWSRFKHIGFLSLYVTAFYGFARRTSAAVRSLNCKAQPRNVNRAETDVLQANEDGKGNVGKQSNVPYPYVFKSTYLLLIHSSFLFVITFKQLLQLSLQFSRFRVKVIVLKWKCLCMKYSNVLAIESYFWLVLPMMRHCTVYGCSNRTRWDGR